MEAPASKGLAAPKDSRRKIKGKIESKRAKPKMHFLARERKKKQAPPPGSGEGKENSQREKALLLTDELNKTISCWGLPFA